MHTVLRVPRISSGSLFAKRFFAVLSRGSVEYGRILTRHATVYVWRLNCHIHQVYEAFEFAGGDPPPIQVHEGPRD